MLNKKKKRKYNHRILEVEKATFVPLVFTTCGGMSPECEKCNKRIAEILAIKTKESYSDIMSFIRKKISFALLKATLIAIRAGVSNLFGQRATCNLRMIARATGVFTAKTLLQL